MSEEREISIKLRPEVLQFLISLIDGETRYFICKPDYLEQLRTARYSLRSTQEGRHAANEPQPDSEAIARLEDRVSALESAFAAIQQTLQEGKP